MCALIFSSSSLTNTPLSKTHISCQARCQLFPPLFRSRPTCLALESFSWKTSARNHLNLDHTLFRQTRRKTLQTSEWVLVHLGDSTARKVNVSDFVPFRTTLFPCPMLECAELGTLVRSPISPDVFPRGARRVIHLTIGAQGSHSTDLYVVLPS